MGVLINYTTTGMAGRKTVEEEFVEFGIPELDDNGKELSKNARKKLLTTAKKNARKQATAAKQEQSSQKTAAEDTSKGKYGDLPLIQSQTKTDKKYVDLKSLSKDNAGETVTIRVRMQGNRPQSRFIFLTLRQQFSTIQGVCSKPACSPQMMAFVKKISTESIVDITGTLAAPEQLVKSTTQQDIELQVSEVWVVSSSVGNLPLLLEDAERPHPLVAAQKKEIKALDDKLAAKKLELESASEEDKKKIEQELEELAKERGSAQKFVVVGKATRFDNRVLDLRTTTNQALFRIRSGVCQLYREFLYSKGFVEIHSPKLIGTASEGGAEVFKVGYFERDAYLAQSPQLYKQMCISADFDRVFEVGPVFRAEKSKTRRHLTEFVGLDLEMAIKEHYHEVLDLFDELFVFLFDGLEKRYADEINVVRTQYPSEPLVYSKPSLRLQWPQAISMLREAGVEVGDFEDFNTAVEIQLGQLVKAKYNTDFYMLDRFPYDIRPFYTMPCADDARYSNSYDFFIRGQEILSGAQRIHDPELLAKSAELKGVGTDAIADYINSFKYGAFPHAGGGIGLERVVMLYLNIPNVQYTSLFPRTMYRLHP